MIVVVGGRDGLFVDVVLVFAGEGFGATSLPGQGTAFAGAVFLSEETLTLE